MPSPLRLTPRLLYVGRGPGMRPHPHLFHEVSLGGAIAIEHIVCVDQPTSQVHLDRGREAERRRHKEKMEGGIMSLTQPGS